MPVIRILEEAAEEAIEAAAWYEAHRPGLGQEFSRAIEDALDLLQDEIVPLVRIPFTHDERAKRLILRRFPYDVVVMNRRNEIVLIAFAHHSRLPGYWQNRVHI
jgi:toxin ParE1/3/4